MNSRRIFHLASGLLLTVAVSCLFLALREPEPGVRIPVHCANGKIGYIDDHGRMAIAPKWDIAGPFGPDDHALVSTTRIPTKIESIFDRWFLRRITLTKTNSYRIDRRGNLTPLERPIFNSLPVGKGPTAPVGWSTQSVANETPQDEPRTTGPEEMTLIQRSDFRWIHRDGSPAFPGSWQQAIDFKEDDPAAVMENRRWGFINRKGETVVPYRWDDTHGFDGHGRACVAIGLKWGVIDREGHLVVPLQFKSLAGFDERNLCAAELASGWGFIDPKGKIAIPFRYQKAVTFDRFGMAKIHITEDRVNLRCGWIDRTGKYLVQPRYEEKPPLWVSNFTDHELLPVFESGKAGLIDRRGRTVVASANGDLKPVGDPAAPGKFWIVTSPYRSSHPPNEPRPPFQPACHDSVGHLVWNGNTLTPTEIFAMAAVFSGLISILLFVLGKRAPTPSSVG